MVTLLLLWSVIQISEQSDIALLLGTGSDLQFQIDLYNGHMDPAIQICPNQTISFDGYPGTFDNDFKGRIGSIYIDNIGIFVCGGYTSSGQPEGGCNWLRVDRPVEVASIRHTWQKIGYTENQNPENMFGCAVVEKEVHNSTGFWITGGKEGHSYLPTRSTYDWEYSEEGVKDITYHPVPKEPFGRFDHCLVKVKTAHDGENYQYLEIGGDVPQQPGPPMIETYHCTDASCSEMKWTEQPVDLPNPPDWTRPSCTVYQPAGSTEDVVVVVSGGISFIVSCGSWLPQDFTCRWEVREVEAILVGGFFSHTDDARLVTLNNVPTLFGVSGTHVFQFGADELWLEQIPMKEERFDLVAVSVPDDYLCYGKHSFAPIQPTTSISSSTTAVITTAVTTTAPTTTAVTTTPTPATTTSTSDPDECESEGSCSRADGRGVRWEATFGSEAVKDCPESGESEGKMFFGLDKGFYLLQHFLHKGQSDQVLPGGIVPDALGTSSGTSLTGVDVLRPGSTTLWTWYQKTPCFFSLFLLFV